MKYIKYMKYMKYMKYIKQNKMSFDNECIFCLELLNQKSDLNHKVNCKYTLPSINIVGKGTSTYHHQLLLDIINKNIKLKCNHFFHLECFFMYIKYNSKTLDSLKCPLCRYNIFKTDIRKILISYFILLKKLSLQIHINNLCNFYKKSYNQNDNQSDTDQQDTKFLQNKICFKLRQIIKLVLI